MLIVAGALWLVFGIMLIVVGAQRNKQVWRLYAQAKGAKTELQQEMLGEQDALEPEYKDKYWSGLIAAGVLVILVLIGLVVGFLFLPGYPLSKYMSYSQCQALAS